MLTRRLVLVGSVAALVSSCATYDPASVTDPEALTVERMTGAVNGVRRQFGSNAVAYNAQLAAAARRQANFMAQKDKLSHNLGMTLRERVTEAGFEGAVGENVAGGHKTLEAAIDGWLASPGHRNTLLTNKFTQFGLAVARVSSAKKSRYGIYWALVMGGDFAAWRI